MILNSKWKNLKILKNITLNKNYFLGNKSHAKVHLQYNDRELTINYHSLRKSRKEILDYSKNIIDSAAE